MNRDDAVVLRRGVRDDLSIFNNIRGLNHLSQFQMSQEHESQMVKTRMSNMKREKRNMILFMTILLIGLVVLCIPFTDAPITKVD